MEPSDRSLRVFYVFTESSRRRAALLAPPGAAERYCLYGLDQLARHGVRVGHNLEGPGPSRVARRVERLLNRWLYGRGGFGGEFGTVLAERSRMNRADVVFATVDSVATPVALARRAGLLRRPFVYGSVGLPERLATLRGRRMTRRFADALSRAAAIVAYSQREAELLRAWFADHGREPRVVFVPFGVDAELFRPGADGSAPVDVASVGADAHRDFPLLLRVAERRPELEVRIAASPHSAPPGPLPANVRLELDVPFAAARELLAAARVVALPVEENAYSGGTTVLLQAMALGKPVVVSRTEAISRGYGLEDGVNCRLVEPGDLEALDAAVGELLADETTRARLGLAARETVERSFTWQRYADTIQGLLAEAAEGRRT